jgi:hypothetical protein
VRTRIVADAVGQAHLHDVVVELDELEAGAAIEVHAGGADLQLRRGRRRRPRAGRRW